MLVVSQLKSFEGVPGLQVRELHGNQNMFFTMVVACF